MSEAKLLDAITNGQSIFTNEIFSSNISLDSITSLGVLNLKFKHCVFNRKLLLRNYVNHSFTLTLYGCQFEKVIIEDSQFPKIEFVKVSKLSSLIINNCRFNYFTLRIHRDRKAYYGLENLRINNEFHCSGLEVSEGIFAASINLAANNTHLKSFFNSCTFTSLSLSGNLGETSFEKNNIIDSSEFSDIVFTKAYFNNSTLGALAIFNNCEFQSVTSFKEAGGVNSKIHLQICNFKAHTYFTDAKFNHFEITDSTFDARVSFVGLDTSTIVLHLVNFNKVAFFDDLRVHSIKTNTLSSTSGISANSLRRTFRQIKQELQRTENKIDYNRFRSYELSAYFRELTWSENFKDKFILGATWLVTGFDHSWRRSLFFSVVAGLLFYSLFYISEYYFYTFDISKWQSYVSGYFRFLLVTDFYNPLATGRTYIDNTNTIGWFIFILGKIVIAFGIYEMIQAFRKFKA